MNNISYYLRGIELMQMVRKIVEENDRRRRGGVDTRPCCTCNDGKIKGSLYVVCPSGHDFCEIKIDPFVFVCCY